MNCMVLDYQYYTVPHTKPERPNTSIAHAQHMPDIQREVYNTVSCTDQAIFV